MSYKHHKCSKNLDSFVDYMKNLDHELTFIGLSDTWLNTNSKELYNIGGYNNVSAYRENRKGGVYHYIYTAI